MRSNRLVVILPRTSDAELRRRIASMSVNQLGLALVFKQWTPADLEAMIELLGSIVRRETRDASPLAKFKVAEKIFDIGSEVEIGRTLGPSSSDHALRRHLRERDQQPLLLDGDKNTTGLARIFAAVAELKKALNDAAREQRGR